MIPVERYRYKNAIIRMHGDIDIEHIKATTIIFMKKVRTRKTKERNNGDKNKAGAVVKKQIQNK